MADLAYSAEHEQYIPAQTKKNGQIFRRDAEDRDALGVRKTSLVEVKESEHLKRPRALLNNRGEPERRCSLHGDGLYASRNLPKFTVVGEYLGKIIHETANAKGKSNYRFAVVDLRDGRTVYTIDGNDKEVSSIVRYANAADTLQQVNAEFVQFRRRAFLVTTKKIKARDEIITWYGEDTEVINSSPKGKKRARDVFLVDRIVARRQCAGKDAFLVKWQGYSDEHDSWEPEENIFDEKELRRARKLPSL